MVEKDVSITHVKLSMDAIQILQNEDNTRLVNISFCLCQIRLQNMHRCPTIVRDRYLTLFNEKGIT